MKKLFIILIIIVTCLGLISCAKKLPSEQLLEAQKDLASGDPMAAMIKLNKIIKENPDDPIIFKAKMILTQAKEATNDNAGALDIVNDLIDEYGLEDRRGQIAFQEKIRIYTARMNEPKRSLALLEEVYGNLKEKEERDEEFFLRTGFGLAYHYSITENIDKSKEILEYILKETEDEQAAKEAMLALTDMYDNEEKFDKSLGIFQTFQEKFPDGRYANWMYFEMGSRYEKLGQEEKAQERYTEGIEKYEQAISDTLDINRKSELLIEVGQAYDKIIKNTDEAIKKYQTIIDEYPGSGVTPKAMEYLIEIYLQNGNDEKAKELAQKMLSAYPRTEFARLAQEILNRLAMEKAQEQLNSTTEAETTGE